jgi:hypothetical protein
MSLPCRSIVALTAALLLAGQPAFAQGCRGAEEIQAISIRALHTELMVSALACIGQTEDSFRSRYGSYVQKFSSDLVQNGAVMKKHMGRGLDQFVTQLANVIAQRSKNDPGFCTEVDKKLNIALQPATTSIVQIPPAYDYNANLGVRPCATATTTPPPAKK